MKPTFPLFRLPENAITQVLERMKLNQLFYISLFSTRAKTLVTSTRFEADLINIKVSRFIDVEVHFRDKTTRNLYFYYEGNAQNAAAPVDDLNRHSPVDLTLPVHAILYYENAAIQSSTPLNFSDWMNHIRTVFSFTKLPNVNFYQDSERFDIQYLKEAIGNVDFLFVDIEVTDVYSEKIVKCFNAPSELTLERNPFDETCEIQKIFIKNFKTIEFDDVYSLDDMLLVNSEKVTFRHPTTQKQFNQFVKHWIRGSNARQQHMVLSIDKIDFASGEVYLSGVRRIEMNEEAKQEIRRKHRLLESVDLIKIKRKDGTLAVFGSAETENIIYVHLIVLH